MTIKASAPRAENPAPASGHFRTCSALRSPVPQPAPVYTEPQSRTAPVCLSGPIRLLLLDHHDRAHAYPVVGLQRDMLTIFPSSLILVFLIFCVSKCELCYALGSDAPGAGSVCSSRAPPRSHSMRIPFTLEHEYRLALPEDDTRDLSHAQSLFTINTASSADRSLQDPLLPPSTTAVLAARPTSIWRPRDPFQYEHARQRSLRHGESELVQWERVEVTGPDIEDKQTVGQLARMSGNAYAIPGQKNWYDLDGMWNTSFPFGWEDAADGFRGHVFVAPDNGTVVLSIKGTTLQGPTSKKDKFNDNLLFSCCCARVDFSWVFSTVCDCYANSWKCDQSCLNQALVEDSLFYSVGVNLVTNLTALYPTSTIWLVGHSLGGALASLLGTTFGLPAVAFEAPGERRAAERLHLPLPPADPASSSSSDPSSSRFASGEGHFGSAPVTHVYHNADPIPQGVCTGFGSPCVAAGYALETRCHLGRSVVYDTVGKLGWRVDVRYHPIRTAILDVIEREMEDGWEEDCEGFLREVPAARVEADCVDCYKWEFGDFKKKK